MPYCIYLRKSRADADAELKGEGETLSRHEKILLELSKKLKLDITQIYREIVSGETISSRPVMQLLLSEVEKGLWSGVLVMEVERLARGDTIDQGIVAQTFKYSNSKIITPMKIYDPNNEFDEEYFEFGLFMSRREYKTINRRLQQGRIQSVKEGKFLGTSAAYGYKKVKIENEKGYTLAPVPNQEAIVKMIFDLYTKGYSETNGRIGISVIVRKLNSLKIEAPKNKKWVPSTIQGMLRNPVYIGKIRWNSRPTVKKMVDGQVKHQRPRSKEEDCLLVDGLHEPIIDLGTWNLAQQYLKNNRTNPIPIDKKIINPLSGLVVCGVCGRKMIRRPSSQNQDDTLICAATSCNNISCRLSYVEEHILISLENWLKEYKLEFKIEDSNKPDNMKNMLLTAIKKSDENIFVIKQQIDNLHNMLERNIYTTDKFLERSKILRDRFESAIDEKSHLEKELEKSNFEQKNIIPKIEKILEIYSKTNNPAIKNELLKDILEKAVYIKNKNGRWHCSPDNFELTLYPKIPKDL